MSSSDEDVSLASRRKRKTTIDSDFSDDDVPLSKNKKQSSPSTNDTSVSDDDMDVDYDEEESTTSKRKKKTAPKKKPAAKRAKKEVKSEDEDSDVPLSQAKASTKKKAASRKPAAPKTAAKKAAAKPKTASVKKEAMPKKESTPAIGEEEEEGETFKWWEQNDMDGEIKWETLEHNGVIFPPEYEPLPSHVKMYYDGKPVTLPVAAEEVAGFFGAMVETDHAKNPVFQKNFFNDFKEVLGESGGCNVDIKSFEKMDFSKIFAYYELKKDEKKMLTSAEKKVIKADKDKLEEPYKICLLNGRKEQIGNFRIEPPGLFRGRGAHPKTGKLKRRVSPEDVTLNIGKDAVVPEPPVGHKWGEVRHDNTVAWLAMWRENISNSFKYVRFAASSSIKGVSDFKKFEKSRELKKHIDAIRKDYRKALKDELMLKRQMAVATYLIDVFALRAGGEKGDDEADTVGCCSLRYEHVTLKPPNTVVFDFLGKDSIRYYQEVEVDKQVFKNLRIFKKPPKQPGDDLFDRLDPPLLNKHLQNYMPGLTAKVFRTYNASKTMQDQLDLIPNEGTVNEKVVRFNAANREVAILCNHQRTVGKNHEASVQKINDKIKEMIWSKIRLKKMILAIDKTQLKKNPKYFGELEDITKEEEGTIHRLIIERTRDQTVKKFKRDNDKLKSEGEKELPEIDLKEKLEKVDELAKEYAKELKTGKVEIKGNATIEKLEQQVEKLEVRITNTTLQLKDKEDNSQVALGTSKLNYIDPRLTVMFAKKYNVPIEKLFTKTLREKFNWAIESADADWRF